MSGWTMSTALDLAVAMEEQSIKLYTSAQEKATRPGSKEMLRELAVEEEKHRSRLLTAKMSPVRASSIGAAAERVIDLGIVDHLEGATLSPQADYQQILIYAGKREKEAHDLYMELAKKSQDKGIEDMFAQLAQEELRHKYRIEREYDDVVLAEM